MRMKPTEQITVAGVTYNFRANAKGYVVTTTNKATGEKKSVQMANDKAAKKLADLQAKKTAIEQKEAAAKAKAKAQVDAAKAKAKAQAAKAKAPAKAPAKAAKSVAKAPAKAKAPVAKKPAAKKPAKK